MLGEIGRSIKHSPLKHQLVMGKPLKSGGCKYHLVKAIRTTAWLEDPTGYPLFIDKYRFAAGLSPGLVVQLDATE